MQTNLKWNKGMFSNMYKIYSNGTQVGSLSDNSFSQSSVGVFGDKKYKFQTTGLFDQKTQVIDAANNKSIGVINYSNLMTKATITINGKIINWKYDNMWNTKSSISNSEGIDIKYYKSSSGGKIESNTDDELLLLAGLFVINYYWQMTIAVLVIFIPIWVSIV